MSFQQQQARFLRLCREHSAWQLLKADNAPHILAFVADLFHDENDIAFGRAKAALETELQYWDTDVTASTYLRQWIQAGWLRELNDQLSKTDACEIALRFCHSLDQRDTNATASHLRIVQDAVRDLALALNADPQERVTLLEARKTVLQNEIDALNAGVVYQLSEAEQHERLREVYQLAAVLTGDFRRLEDDIRQLDQKLRVQMIESKGQRGEVLLNLLQNEHILSQSDAGKAFDGFFTLLMDVNRSTEFREQIKFILGQPAANLLNNQQYRYLNQLMRALTQESDRVLNIRRRTEESLRNFLEQGEHAEHHAVDRLLNQLEQFAIQLKQENIPLKTELKLMLPTGNAKISSPLSWQLKMPTDQIDTSQVQTHENTRTPSTNMLAHLQSVKILAVADTIYRNLREHGPLTIAGLVEKTPIKAGLEELVAHLRISQSVAATRLTKKETVLITDHNGDYIEATIPCYLLHADLFPEKLENLSL